MKKLIVIFTLIFLAFGFNACDNYVIPPSGDVYVSFSTSVQPIFNSDCVSCHTSRDPILSEGVSHNSLINGGYVNTSSPESSSLYQKLLGSHDSRTSTNNKAIILDWIEAGTPND